MGSTLVFEPHRHKGFFYPKFAFSPNAHVGLKFLICKFLRIHSIKIYICTLALVLIPKTNEIACQRITHALLISDTGFKLYHQVTNLHSARYHILLKHVNKLKR